MKGRPIVIFGLILAALIYVLIAVYGNNGTQSVNQAGVGGIGLGGTADVTLDSPVRIASSAEGELFVSDYTRQMILTLDAGTLDVKASISVSGRPSGLAWGRGKLFVGNDTTGNVEVYNKAGKLFYILGSEEGAIRQPTEIAVAEDEGLVFVVDGYDRLVKVFDPSGSPLYSFPDGGVSSAQLKNPTGITVDKERGEVLVSDYGDVASNVQPKIQVYKYDGEYVFGISGSEPGGDYRFSRPQGLAVDNAGNIFLVDAMRGKVLVIDRNSKQGIKSIGSFGSGEGELLLPLDIVLDSETGDVFVTSNHTAKVEAFRGGGLIQ